MDKLKVNRVSKKYGSKVLLDNISFQLEENKIYGLLGRNSQGKSTLLNIIADKVFSNSGTIEINNQNIHNNDQF